MQVNASDDVERVMAKIATLSDVGVIVMPDNFTTFYRALIIALAGRFRIPTIYPFRYFVEEGGLISLGVDGADLFRRAADYVDRVLWGESARSSGSGPDKVELAINLKPPARWV